MNTRLAALALAAPLFFAAPAVAGAGPVALQAPAMVIGHHGVSSYGRYNQSRHDYTRREVRQMRRAAIRKCRRAIRTEASYLGFRDVDFEDGRRVRRIGPQGFRVVFNEVEFEGHRRDFERRVSCTVRRGDVRRLEGVPEPRRRAHRHWRYHY